MDIKENFYSKLQQIREGKDASWNDKYDERKKAMGHKLEEEQLDELRKPKNIDKLKKHMGDAAQAASDAAYEKGGKHYDDATVKRRKAIKSKKREDMDDANAEQGKMSKSWKRSIAFGKIADRKKK